MAAQAPDGVAVALPAEVHGFAVVGRPDSQSAAVSPPPEVMQVQCPPGVSEGMPVQVTAPSGVMMQVQVPPNITEGMTFGVSLPPAAPLAVYQISGDRCRVTTAVHAMRKWTRQWQSPAASFLRGLLAGTRSSTMSSSRARGSKLRRAR